MEACDERAGSLIVSCDLELWAFSIRKELVFIIKGISCPGIL